MPETLKSFSLSVIRPCRWQPRTTFDAAGLAELARSIRDHTLINPLIVYLPADPDSPGPEPELLAGERRTRAMLANALLVAGRFKDLDEACAFFAAHGLETLRQDEYREWAIDLALHTEPVPCRVVAGTPAQLQEIAVIDNLQRADLDPLDEARALQRLIAEHGLTQRALAAKIGKSQTYISQRLVLLELHPTLVDQLFAGELDQAAARELARLAPGAQPAARRYAADKRLSSRQVQGMVARVLEYAQPESWPAVGADAQANALVAASLAAKEPVERQQAVLRIAENLAGQTAGAQIARPKQEYEYRRALTILGVKDADQGVNAAFMHNAPELLGAACATCQVYPFLRKVQELAARAGRANVNLPDRFPRCVPGGSVCPAYLAPGAEVRLSVPMRDREPQPPGELAAHLVERSYWHGVADDIEAGLAIADWSIAAEAAAAAQRADREQHGFYRALAQLASDQALVSPKSFYSFYSQPCAHCAFHKRGARNPEEWCAYQAHQPGFEAYNGENNFASLLRSDQGKVIVRCTLFRYRKIEQDLPDLGTDGYGITAPVPVYLALLRRILHDYGDRSFVPAFLDCPRTEKARADARPGWSAGETYLQNLAGRLTAGQRLALMLLWDVKLDHYRVGQAAKALAPDTGEHEQWTCVTTYGADGVERAEGFPPKSLAEVFAAENAATHGAAAGEECLAF